MSHQPDAIYTSHGLADQVQDPNFDVQQVLHHLAANMEGLTQLQQQFGALQTHVQNQANADANQQVPATLHTITSSLESLITVSREQQLMHQAFSDSVATILNRLSQRPHPSGHRAPIPLALSPKFKGENDTYPLEEFQSKLQLTFERFPESLATDQDRIRYAISSMEGPAAQYFAPYVNLLIADETGILLDYSKFLDTLENIYGDQHNIDELNAKLSDLRQHPGTIVEYITKFRSLSGRVGWNEVALVAQFKKGLSLEIKTIMSTNWHKLRTLGETMTAAATAYQTLQFQQKSRPRPTGPRSTPQPYVPRTRAHHSAPSPSSSAMDLDNVRTKKITLDEKLRRRTNNLCMYCGGGEHYASSCPKKAQLASISAIDSENESA